MQQRVILMAQHKTHNARVWRIAKLLAFSKFARCHSHIVAHGNRAYYGVLGLSGLNDDPTPIVAPTCTTCHLHHKLKGTLRRAEIGLHNEIVGIEDTHGSDTSKVEALGDNLRADKDICLSLLEAVDNTAKCRL